ncbi:aminotransferase-like domain-containing protein [Sabulicella rubraurantiaca]|uniref:aminotransferase-like domain-containing protein n=1 Tax=Sabulicella rubraurantiaca TaxID=2811429 RepID=UPI001F1A5D8E|nr:PLP-dependent aminotransferase family protein [Sabulicella rubraurantiaca]
MQKPPESMQAARPWAPRLAGRGGPIYLAIADAIDEAIKSGELPGGARLPTHRAMAEALGVDLTTVTRAYREARQRGLLEATVGRGTFVRKTSPEAASVGRAEGRGLIDLSMNLPPEPSDPPLRQLIQTGLADLLSGPDAASLLTYRPGAGSAEERAAGAAWVSPTLGEVDPGLVLVSPGAQPALLATLGLVARAGDLVLTDALTYPGFRGAAAQLGIRLCPVACDADGMLPDAVEEACRGDDRPRALYCIPTLQNPTSITLPLERRQALVDVARRHRLRILEDDAYGVLPVRPLPALAALAPEITFHVSTLSKVISPALRVAYVVAPDQGCAAKLAAALRANVLTASPLLTALATKWVRDGTARSLLSAVRRECMARQEIAREILPAGSFLAQPEGLHLWLRLLPPWRRLDFASRIREQGLAIVPSDAFAVGEGTPPDAVRVSLGAAPSREQLRIALRAIATVFAGEASAPFLEIV